MVGVGAVYKHAVKPQQKLPIFTANVGNCRNKTKNDVKKYFKMLMMLFLTLIHQRPNRSACLHLKERRWYTSIAK